MFPPLGRPRDIKTCDLRPLLEPGPCELWQFYKLPKGHGSVADSSRPSGVVLVHRYVWARMFGPIPAGLIVRHSCDTPACFRLSHLQLGTIADNNHDMAERNRAAAGSKHHWARLTETDVAHILRLLADGLSQIEVARRFNIHQSGVSLMQSGKTWRIVPRPDKKEAL